ncbi:UvrD-helicase domain-containing protein [Pseudomonas aeruginosa]|uniref:UvrD-helicase domain-containing protein n=1 Tax=Pseudomonas alloputida TaxID=1940621 RepID=UPI001E4DC92C|nr:UvrD-helicase domain-containing protein [Pseudomonas alloputida]MCE0864723.1 UvrD-helicase domain-containing protein [Pseudomonas alloputida]
MIKPERWVPSPGIRLERNAWEAIREREESVVLTAGPGAGKTEVLAQRADFLLRTNSCRYPKRILAVSFKTDASRNLKQRVQLRCGWDYSSRFDSVTFHGFAKRIIDRFHPILVDEALSQDYEIGPQYTCLYGQEQAEAWSRLMDHFTPFEDDDSRSSAQRIFEETYREHLKKVKQERKTANPYASWWDMANEFLKKLGFSSVSALSADYRSKARLLEIVREVRERIRGLLATEPDLLRALARLSDDSAVRFLTMHKSKGLEFHSVVVLGVEQQTFWGQLDQERCVFFVGISRAKNRLVLTTADYRPWPKNARRWDEHRAPHAEFVSHVVRHLTKQHF